MALYRLAAPHTGVPAAERDACLQRAGRLELLSVRPGAMPNDACGVAAAGGAPTSGTAGGAAGASLQRCCATLSAYAGECSAGSLPQLRLQQATFQAALWYGDSSGAQRALAAVAQHPGCAPRDLQTLAGACLAEERCRDAGLACLAYGSVMQRAMAAPVADDFEYVLNVRCGAGPPPHILPASGSRRLTEHLAFID